MGPKDWKERATTIKPWAPSWWTDPHFPCESLLVPRDGDLALVCVSDTCFCPVCNQLHVNLCHVQMGVLATSEALEVRVDFLSPAHGCFHKHYSSHFEISESVVSEQTAFLLDI